MPGSKADAVQLVVALFVMPSHPDVIPAGATVCTSQEEKTQELAVPATHANAMLKYAGLDAATVKLVGAVEPSDVVNETVDEASLLYCVSAHVSTTL